MHSLRGIYSRVRIALYAFAIGLACVWSYNAFLAGSETVNVTLPTAESSDVLGVFVKKSRFTGLGGGSGPHGPHISLRQIESDSSELSFNLKNFLEDPIYLPTLEQTSGTLTRVPYWVECQDREHKFIRVVPQHFVFAANPTRLDPGQSLVIRIKPPGSARSCVVIVPYAENEEGASDLVVENPYVSSREDDFLEKLNSRMWVAAISERISDSP